MVSKILVALAFFGLLLGGGGPALAEGLTITDDSGRRVAIKPPYKRIVSLYAAHTENLFALGAGERVVAVTRRESFPPAALKLPAVSHRDGPERLAALSPDLVLLRPMIANGYPHLVERLTRLGITVLSLQPTDPAGMLDYWRTLGMLTGRETQAERLVADFEAGVKAFERHVAHIPPPQRPGVYFESIHRKMKTFAPGAMALFCLAAAGGRNLAGDAPAVRGTNIASYGKERILALADKIDVFLAQKGAMNQVTVKAIKQESGFAAIRAVAGNRVFLVPEELVSRPTPRLLKGIQLIQTLLYPDLSGAADNAK